MLFALVMTWQAFVAWQYVYGLVATAFGDRAKSALERRSLTVPAEASGLSRTAAVVAIHAEDAVAVFAALRVMARSLQRDGGDGGDIDIFVLSDTRDGAIAAVEEHEFARIEAWTRQHGPGLPRIRYRRRRDNAGRKAGNIAEFCKTYGAEYDFMIVLDADSLMTGSAMRRLARLMEESPRVGLIQTVSYATGRDTLFARIQQFAVRLYAPLAIRCLETWQGPDGSYWGHNAIVRVAAFADNAELPVLPGKAPLGRRDPVPRHRRGRAPAPGRLGGPPAAGDGRHLGGDADEPRRPPRARAPLVPGQHAAPARAPPCRACAPPAAGTSPSASSPTWPARSGSCSSPSERCRRRGPATSASSATASPARARPPMRWRPSS